MRLMISRTSLTAIGRLAFLAMAAALLAACSQTLDPAATGAAIAPPADGASPQPASFTPGAAAPLAMAAHKLGPADKLKVIVFREEQLSGEFQIDGAGFFSMPLIGQVQAAGLTQAELEKSITGKLAAGYLKDPKVSVLVTDLRPIYVLGEVKTAGEYPFKAGLNAVSAVALAGGYSYRANTSQIYIRRAGESAERPYPAVPTVTIMPGDTIRVAERYF
jgi:polysaccharide export outer membrane protein